MVVINTKQDLIHAQHIYTNPWACEVGGYFAADLLILFYIQWMKVNKDLRLGNKYNSYVLTSFLQYIFYKFCIPNYYRKALMHSCSTLLTWHHFLLLTVALPIILCRHSK